VFEPGDLWNDTDGKPIQAHGGGILYYRGMYYWFGENKDGNTVQGDVLERVDVIGISCYSSRDLYHWKNEGIVLPAASEDPEHDLHPRKVVERPKVIYNEATHQFVMWMHIDHSDYSYARAGVAVSNCPAGPYHYLGSIRPCGADCRDLTLFKDDDGTAYLVFASEWNRNITVARLTNDYLTTDGCARNFVEQRREAPAVFKHGRTYFMITSGCTGWAPNPAEYSVASAILGPWETKGNPCVGAGCDTTFSAQGTFVLPLIGRPGAFIFMADRWNEHDLRDSRYVWLPLCVRGTELSVRWLDRWDLSVYDVRCGSGHRS